MDKLNTFRKIGILCIILIATFNLVDSYFYLKSSLILKDPVKVVDWISYVDGGSIALKLKDTNGKVIDIFFDQSIDADRNNNLHLGRFFSEDRGYKIILKCSKVEKEILRYISEWFEKEIGSIKNKNYAIMNSKTGRIIHLKSINNLIKILSKRNC